MPPAMGVDYRIVNGYVYISPNPVTDPEEIGRRLAHFEPRAGHYYGNWDRLYAGWKANLTGELFLAAGTLALLGLLPGGNVLMGIAFGGLHVVLGALILGGSAHETQDRID